MPSAKSSRSSRPEIHRLQTERLARRLPEAVVYEWLVTIGYYPEGYVLPPCFHVSDYPSLSNISSEFKGGKYRGKIEPTVGVHFPKGDLADRTFGVMHPRIHASIAREIATHWEEILDVLFHAENRVFSYSFPIPVSARRLGKTGKLRAGRMIYEWIEMAENDLVAEAHAYTHLVHADVKNFFPSLYTHGIAWAIHGKEFLREGTRRQDFSFLGNRLDKLFQAANDGCTNGVPIGPAVSDLATEVVLSAVDVRISPGLEQIGALAVRFKDDYRILCRTVGGAQKAVKILQRELKSFGLLLSEQKTAIRDLPGGLFRDWTHRYEAVRTRRNMSFRTFSKVYVAVLEIDDAIPNTGIVEKFLSDLTTRRYRPRVPVTVREAEKAISLLLLLARRRVRAFPMILGVIEAVIDAAGSDDLARTTAKHFTGLLLQLSANQNDNQYLIVWILYFLKSRKLSVPSGLASDDPVIKSLLDGKNRLFSDVSGFDAFRRPRKAHRAGSLLRHLEVFQPR